MPGPFKSGLYHLASQFPQVQLVPVYLDNLHRALPKSAVLPIPMTCTVRFGPPMALAPVVYCLWQRLLRFDPDHAIWPNRDRFVLSVGHASMLLYSMLHLTGVKAVNPKYETLGALFYRLQEAALVYDYSEVGPL